MVNGTVNDATKHLTWLEDFVARHYPKMPAAVRIPVFILFAVLLAYAIYRVVGGEFTVRGRILTQAPGAFEPARNFDIQYGDRFFGTNSKGFYYLILGPWEYGVLLAKGSLKLEVTNGPRIFPEQEVRFDLFRRQFADIRIAPPEVIGRVDPAPDRIPASRDFLVPPLLAQSPSVADRLFVHRIRLNPDLQWAAEGRLELRTKGGTASLMSARTRRAAGRLPLVPGEPVVFENEYYFEVPPAGQGISPGELRLVPRASIFRAVLPGSPAESFQIPLTTLYGEIVKVMGEKGSEIEVIRLGRYDVTIFEKTDLAAVARPLQQDLTRHGFRVVHTRSVLGEQAETNALFAGRSVPYDVLQRVLGVLGTKGVRLKSVQYRQDLASGNPYEMQLGGAARFNAAPVLPDERLRRLVRASSETEFQQVLATIR